MGYLNPQKPKKKVLDPQELRNLVLGGKDLSAYDYSDITEAPYLLYGIQSLLETPNIDTSKMKNLSNLFYNCHNLKRINKLDMSNAENISDMFLNCNSIEEIGDIYAPKAKDLDQLFSGCTGLKKVGNIYAPLAKNMYSMFKNCSRLESVGSIKTASPREVSFMFEGCDFMPEKPFEIDFAKAERLNGFSKTGLQFINIVGKEKTIEIMKNKGILDNFKTETLKNSDEKKVITYLSVIVEKKLLET